MSTGDFLHYEALGIAKLLRTRTLAVPFYQRSYSWRSENSADTSDVDEKLQVVDFWTDLQASFVNKTSYFLGTAVVARSGDDGRQLVIDGQQRLATTSILIAAIRDKFIDEGEHQFGESTQQEYIGKFDRRVGSDRPIFILGAEDRAFYEQRIVHQDKTVLPVNNSQALMLDAYEYLRARVDEFSDQAGTAWRDRLNDLTIWLDDDVQVVAIDVATEADAFLIFETLNDRGADLTIADLLKNFLFSQAGNRLDEVRDLWVGTLGNLNIDKVGNQRFTDFARHLLSSKSGRTRERDVYQRIKSLVNNPSSAVAFAQELKDASRLYYAILTSDSEYWADFKPTVVNATDVLVELNLEQYRPLMLSVLSTFEKSEIERFIPALVSWVIRGLAVGSLGAGAAETAFSEAARDIRGGKIKTTEEILSSTRVGNLVPDDSSFEPAFATWKVTRGPLARYLLRVLELVKRGDEEPELVVNPDVEAVNLEHILPRNARLSEWPSFSEDEQKTYVHRIGNLCLLQRGPNGRIGNKGWAIKQPILALSNFELTKDAAGEEDWIKDSIDQRQSELARLALSAWPRHPRE